MTVENPSALLRHLFDAALGAVTAEGCVPANLPDPPKGRTVGVGAGKAAAAMAQSVERHWRGPMEGLVVTRDGHGLPCDRIEVVEAAHPVPDERGLAAARRILDLANGLAADDLMLCLISGGGSSLLAVPAPGLGLDDKRAINRALLRSGASIDEMNTVRKHLSAIKGGRLAPGDLRCAGRRTFGDRLGPDRAGPDHVRRGASDLARIRHRMPGRGRASPRR